MYVSEDQKGYIALITAILISISLLILTMAVSFEGYFSRFTVLESDHKEKSMYLAEACVQTAILKLAQDSGYTGGEMIPVGDDECRIVPGTGGNTILVQASSSEAYTNLEVEVGSDSNIVRWEEVPTH